MAYIGNNLTVQQYAPQVAYFSGNGSTTAFTLPIAVVSAAQIIVAVENVIQNPSTAFSVSGTTLTFTSAPPSGTNNVWVEYTSLQTTANALPAYPSIVGDLVTSGGQYAAGAFNSAYTDGVVTDYVTGNGRLTVGGGDGLTIYNGGPSSRSALMSINSSGNVGIGTTSPVSTLNTVNPALTSSSGNTSLNATFTNNDPGGNVVNLQVKNYRPSAGTGGSNNRILIQRHTDATDEMYAGFDGTYLTWGYGTTELMRLSQTGYLTTPYCPAFFSSVAGGTYTGGSTFGGSLITTPSQPSTRTAGYSGGTFTAPVTGYYSFAFQVYDFSNAGANYQVYKNGSGYYPADALQMIASANMMAWAFIIYLNANDYVQMGLRSGSSSPNIYSGHSFWSGFLVG